MTIPFATYNYLEFISEQSITTNGYSVLFEGNLTNRVALLKRLECAEGTLIESAYKKWGATFVNQLNGSFCIILFDKQNRTLLMYRDRFGVSPCYYHKTDHFFACSTQVLPLLELPNVKRQLNIGGLGDYLSYGFVHAPQTLVKGIAQLLPGHYLKLTDDEVMVQPYWSATDQYDYTIEGRTEEQHAFQINRLTEQLTMNSPIDQLETPDLDKLEKLLDLAKQVDHPSIETLPQLQYLLHEHSNKVMMATGNAELWGSGRLYEVLVGFQEHRWLLSWPKNMRNIISKWVAIPFKKELHTTYRQLVHQDYYDLDYLFPVYKRLYPIGPLQKSLGISFEDAQKRIAQTTVVFQTAGFVYPYLSKVGLLELQATVANAVLPAVYQAVKLTGRLVSFPYLDQKLQRYLMHVPDGQKANLKKRFQPTFNQQHSSFPLLERLSEKEKNKILFDFQSRSFVKGQLKADIEEEFKRLTLEKRTQLMEAILLLEIWLTENKINE